MYVHIVQAAVYFSFSGDPTLGPALGPDLNSLEYTQGVCLFLESNGLAGG